MSIYYNRNVICRVCKKDYIDDSEYGTTCYPCKVKQEHDRLENLVNESAAGKTLEDRIRELEKTVIVLKENLRTSNLRNMTF